MAVEKIINIQAKTDEALKDIKKLFSEMVDAEKKAQKQTDDLIDGVKDVGKASKNTEKEVKGISKGFKGLGVAIKAAGIGLLISAMASVKEIFSENQRVVDAFSTGFETLSIVVNQVVNALINTYDAVSKNAENFNGLGKVLSGILTIAVTPLKTSFFGIKLAIQEAQLIWEKSFFGGNDADKIKELNKGITETRVELIKIADNAINAGKDIYNNIGDAVGEVANIGNVAIEELSKVSIKSAYETAKTNVALKNSAEIAAAQQSRLVEQYDRQAEQLRQIRDEERNSIEVRKKANDDLLLKLQEQETAMLKQADLQIAAAQAEKNKSNTIENQVALIDALANREGVLAQIEGLRSEQKANDLALDREQNELTKAKLESESLLSIERKRFDAEQIESKLQSLEALKLIDEEERNIEIARLQLLIDNTQQGTQAKIDAEIALNEFKEQSRQLEQNRNKEIIAEEKIVQEAKINMAKNTLSNISKAIGENSKAGKAAAAAASLINTYQGITAELATKTTTPFGFALKLANIATTAAIGFKSVKDILKTNPKSTGGGASSSATGAQSTQAAAPQFNIVGQGGANQLAESIGSQTQEPIQAYVVSNDVTTAQSMQNNIVQGAAIG